jgi:hypothetical protein
MAIEVYKMEIGSTQGGFPRDWMWHWEIGNQSGRDQVEISGDLANTLAVTGLWFFRFRETWSKLNTVHKFRIRKAWPNIQPWNDYYWRFRHLAGPLLQPDTLHNLRARVAWWTASGEVTNACTYLNCYQQPVFKNGLFDTATLGVIEAWASQHDSIQTTSFGDQFRPAILDKWGNYMPVLGHFVDPRPVATRRHQVRV